MKIDLAANYQSSQCVTHSAVRFYIDNANNECVTVSKHNKESFEFCWNFEVNA